MSPDASWLIVMTGKPAAGRAASVSKPDPACDRDTVRGGSAGRSAPVGVASANPARATPESRDPSSLPLARMLLASGGDERITLDAVSGRNRYATPALPAPAEIWLASSTASAISPAGFAAALPVIKGLMAIDGARRIEAPAWLDGLRERILGHFGIEGATAVLAASGTEGELIALSLARATLPRPITNIVIAPAETGSGVLAAASGAHFLGTTSLAGATRPGRRLAGLEAADIKVVAIPVRAEDGAPLPACNVESLAARAVERALGGGRDVLLHVLDCSKTGLGGVSRETAHLLARAAKGRLHVVVDACQLRSSPDRIRADLASGFMVMVTGSKFAGGPPFCGAVLLPPELVDAVAGSGTPPPAGLATLSAAGDWPRQLRRWCGDRLTVPTNLGLGLRWTAALAELDRYLAFPERDRRAALDHFARAVRMRAAELLGEHVVLVQDGGTTSIVPIIAGMGPDALGEAAALHAALRRPVSWLGTPDDVAAMGRVCHVGQPVAIGGRAVLRVCAGAPNLSGVLERQANGASLEQAFAPLAADIDTVLRKWARLAPPIAPGRATRAAKPAPAVPSSPLDPADWEAYRRAGHAALDGMIDELRTLRDRPVWQPMPAEARQRLRAPLPRAPRDLADVLAAFDADIRPYATGNRHPLFMGWVHGAGTPAGMIAEMLAAGLNANCGGRDHAGIEVERQVTRWVAEMLGFPADASGVFVTGTSMANFLAVLVARDAALGHGVRRHGLGREGGRLTAYTSAEAHGCIAQAMELSGIGSERLRRVPADAAGALDVAALAESVAADRRLGLAPFLVVGTAGTVNTGAIDPLARIASLARAERLWFHVDGAFGAMATLAPDLRPRLAGIEEAASVAFDFHKWGHVPYDAGFLLVRDPEAHRGTFASPAAYLSRLPRGLAAGDTWPCDLGPDLSRSFRALKTWMTLAVHGTDRIGAAISRCCRVARYLEARIAGSPELELRAPVALNIVCFGVSEASSDALVPEIIMDLHERGAAVPSLTVIAGRPAIRCAIVNHRTDERDIDRLLVEIATSLAAARSRPGR